MNPPNYSVLLEIKRPVAELAAISEALTRLHGPTLLMRQEGPYLQICKPTTKQNAKANFQCESCGVSPTWGMGRGKWWLTCNCWQTTAGTMLEVLAAWEKDWPKRHCAACSAISPQPKT